MLVRERRPLALMTAGFAGAYMLVGLFRHWHFSSNAFDLGIFDQVIWHSSRFEKPASTIAGHSNIFGDHFHPIIALFAPLYWIAPAPETLIVAQAILLAASLVPVYLFLRARLSAGVAVTLAAAYGCFWGVQRTAWFDVHEIAFAPVLIATAVLAIDQKRWRWLWIASGLLVLVKEDMAPFVSGCGAYLILTGERRRGAGLLAASLVVFALVLLVIIPALNDAGGWQYSSAFESLRFAPWNAPLLLVTPPEKLRLVLYWLVPFLFLPLRSPYALLLIPVALERLLPSNANHWSYGGHYSAPLAPVLAMAAGDGLARLAARARVAHSRRRVVVGVAAAVLVLSAIIPGHQPLIRLFAAKHYRPVAFRDTAHRALASIPAGASVVAQSPIVPHLSQRVEVYVLDANAPDAAYVVAAPGDVSPWPLDSAADIRRLLDERRSRGYRAIFEEGNWIVLAR